MEAIDRLLKVWNRYRGRVIGLAGGILFGLLLLRYGTAFLILSITGVLGYVAGLVWEAQR
ncbi:MAG: hypothetical protein IT210_18880 [Armatimonadetes bacterium]|nr:hypothetical protein [Armatimonadota bacterium]